MELIWNICNRIAWFGGFVSGLTVLIVLIVIFIGAVQDSKADEDDENYYGGDSY